MRYAPDAGSDTSSRRHRCLTAIFGPLTAAVIGLNPTLSAALIDPLCNGDCDQRGAVTVDELVTLVNVALGTHSIELCANGDADGDGNITVDEITTATRRALDGCPTMGAGLCGNEVVDDGEQCDDGAYCIGGPLAGIACTSEDDCIFGGACFGGPDDLHACESNKDCRSASCIRCRPAGGDGCAANCTFENDIVVDIVPGVIDFDNTNRTLAIVPGTSGLGVICSFYYFPVSIPAGSLVLTAASPVEGITTMAVKAGRLKIDPVFMEFGCACVRSPEMWTCGGTTFERDGTPSLGCTAGFPEESSCPVNRPCAPVHGPGNGGSGFVTWGGPDFATEATQDCNGEPSEPAFPPTSSTYTVTGSGDPTAGNALLTMATAFGIVNRHCSESVAEHGMDLEFCTDDDPVSVRGAPMTLPFATGTATGTIFNPVDFEGDINGPNWVEGSPLVSAENGEIDAAGAALTGVFTACDLHLFSDVVVPIVLSFGRARTPGPSDCCQCDQPSTCGAPTAGTCGDCEPVLDAICDGESGRCWTRTPAATPTPTPFPPTPTPGVRVVAGQAFFENAGATTLLEVGLIGEGIIAFQNDILFDNTVLAMTAEGCRLNPLLALFKSLSMTLAQCGDGVTQGCPDGAGANISVLTMLVYRGPKDTEIPVGLVYACEFELLAEDRLPSFFEIERVFARDTDFRSVPAAGVDGVALVSG